MKNKHRYFFYKSYILKQYILKKSLFTGKYYLKVLSDTFALGGTLSYSYRSLSGYKSMFSVRKDIKSLGLFKNKYREALNKKNTSPMIQAFKKRMRNKE